MEFRFEVLGGNACFRDDFSTLIARVLDKPPLYIAVHLAGDDEVHATWIPAPDCFTKFGYFRDFDDEELQMGHPIGDRVQRVRELLLAHDDEIVPDLNPHYWYDIDIRDYLPRDMHELLGVPRT